MKKYLLVIVLLLTGLIVFVTTAFSPTNLSQDNSIFFDDFESYLNSTQLQTSYTVWEDGAVLDIALEKGHLFCSISSLAHLQRRTRNPCALPTNWRSL